MASQNFNIDQTMCATNNTGGENATCVFNDIYEGENANLKREMIRATTYELVCGCLLFSGSDAEEEEEAEEE